MIRIRQVILARSIRQVQAIYSLDYRPDLVAKLKERYSFLRVPATPDAMLGTDPQGIRFQHGKFQGERTFVIELLQFVSQPAGNLIICDTRTSTDDSDLFLDEYINQANLARPDMIVVTEPRIYVSQIEFEMDKSLGEFCQTPLRAAGEALNTLLASYDTKLPPFEPSNIVMMCDQVGLGGYRYLPSPFTIERRSGFRYGSNTFSSQAPLRTSDHIAVLERLATSRA